MSGGDGRRWELREGEQLIGTIIVSDQDFPWVSGEFSPEPGFARWEPVFAAEEALLQELSVDDSDEGWQRWERLYDPIRQRLTLISPSGPVAEFLRHIEGGAARFRWSEDPFDGGR